MRTAHLERQGRLWRGTLGREGGEGEGREREEEGEAPGPSGAPRASSKCDVRVHLFFDLDKHTLLCLWGGGAPIPHCLSAVCCRAEAG